MNNDKLFEIIKSLESEQLDFLLIKLLKIKDKEVDKYNYAHRLNLCSKKIRHVASNSLVNMFRNEHEYPYKKILIDVADKLSPGYTPMSWTKYKFNDSSSENEIEEYILECFKIKYKKWWEGLSTKQKESIKQIYINNIDFDKLKNHLNKDFTKEFIVEQIIESIAQTGLTGLISLSSAGGVLGILGGTLLTQIGWTIAVNTFGIWFGIQSLLGLSFLSLTVIGTAAVGAVVSIPGILLFTTHTNYRKLIPIVFFLISCSRVNKAK